MKRTLLTSLLLVVMLQAMAQISMERIDVERLPDMNVPRTGHASFWLNGELTVFGGHTNGFVPTPTAEYFRNGQWHMMQMIYSHDDALVLPLSSGKVLLAGGHSEPLGIGQTHSVEFYDPTTHTFDGFGCLDTKRTMVSGVEMDNGEVLISGNWYHNDAIELFDGQKAFSPVKEVATPRSRPVMLHIAPDDVIIFSSLSTRGVRYDSIIADRLKGDPFHIPIFDIWHPLAWDMPHNEDNYQIGDYTYLLPAFNDNGSIAIVKMRGSTFSLLPTTAPIPIVDGNDSIYYGNPVVDRQRQRYYLVGSDLKERFYVLSIDYTQQPAPLTVYRSDSVHNGLSFMLPVLTPEGNLILTGGIANDNFHPFTSVYKLLMAQDAPAVASTSGFSATPLVIVIIVLALAALIAYIIYIRRRRQLQTVPINVEEPASDNRQKATMQRIRQLMEQQQLYLNSELKISDVAVLLNTNSRYISSCINAEEGVTFSQFVNNYRVAYAKQLLSHQFEKKMSGIYAEAGFSGESSFFRIFKSATGLTPKEWRKQNVKPSETPDDPS
jgi:AraC-like DNA-binding protein